MIKSRQTEDANARVSGKLEGEMVVESVELAWIDNATCRVMFITVCLFLSLEVY